MIGTISQNLFVSDNFDKKFKKIGIFHRWKFKIVILHID